MQADWFIAGLGSKLEEMTPEQRDTMLLHAEAFLAAGGFLTFDQWATLSDESRAAFKIAGELVRHKQAKAIAAELTTMMLGSFVPDKEEETK